MSNYTYAKTNLIFANGTSLTGIFEIELTYTNFDAHTVIYGESAEPGERYFYPSQAIATKILPTIYMQTYCETPREWTMAEIKAMLKNTANRESVAFSLRSLKPVYCPLLNGEAYKAKIELGGKFFTVTAATAKEVQSILNRLMSMSMTYCIENAIEDGK
ncbi:hypothetical protein KDA11_02345 [Candidatus Saccharibacteria bacterium]|nr:hypothetical protein [Candidatus Saccharibacteria bacterium]